MGNSLTVVNINPDARSTNSNNLEIHTVLILTLCLKFLRVKYTSFQSHLLCVLFGNKIDGVRPIICCICSSQTYQRLIIVFSLRYFPSPGLQLAIFQTQPIFCKSNSLKLKPCTFGNDSYEQKLLSVNFTNNEVYETRLVCMDLTK